jgi:hypothetical protein
MDQLILTSIFIYRTCPVLFQAYKIYSFFNEQKHIVREIFLIETIEDDWQLLEHI